MANLWVGGVDDTLFKALEREAESNGRSVQAEHLAILTEALKKLENRQFIELLMRIPDVGEDADFERVDDSSEVPNVFDRH